MAHSTLLSLCPMSRRGVKENYSSLVIRTMRSLTSYSKANFMKRIYLMVFPVSLLVIAGFFLHSARAGAALVDLIVRDQADLNAYAQAAIEADPSIAGMNFAPDVVEVRYKESAKFLALIPMRFTVKAETHADGSVSVEYPWYSFLTVDNRDRIETELKVAIDNTLRSRLVGSVRAEGEVQNPTFTPAESAQIAG